MSDADLPNKFAEQLATEVARLRDLSIKSSDPLIIAKAIAVSDPGVQQVLLGRLAAGERLVEVFTLEGSARHELQVFFRFVAAEEIIHLVDTGALVFVDSMKGDVIGIVDPFILQPERRVGRPFVTIAALKASAIAAGNQAMQPLVSRQRAFFQGLGLGGLGLTTDTLCDSDITSATYSPGAGGRYTADDTGKETSADYCDSSGDIIV